MGKKIISFSLYNNVPKNNINAIINCMLIPYIYPEWSARFYIDETLPKGYELLLKTFEYVEVINMPKHIINEAMLWRFLPPSDPDVDIMICRDADSWVSSREKACVDEWISSDKNFHIIRDHCYHSQLIMGGMWGIRNNILPQMKNLIEEYMKNNSYDQGFLANIVYPLIKDTLFVHYGDPQYNNKGELIQGYFNDGGKPIPKYEELDEPINGLSFVEVHNLNAFYCAHCKSPHKTYIGAILENLSDKILNVVRNYAKEKNISLELLPGL